MNIVFRTNCNGTLGHLARCRHLGELLQSNGYKTHFILDESPVVNVSWIETLSWRAIYDSPASAYISEKYDAQLCVDIFDHLKPDLIIVDDYRLALDWEKVVGDAGFSLLAIDDLRRAHDVDILLEPKYEATCDTREHDPNCLQLQGTQYTLLESGYAKSQQTRTDDSFNVLFSLGGGGNLQLLHDCLQQLVATTDQHKESDVKMHTVLTVAIGPMATAASKVRALAMQYPGQIRILEAHDSLLWEYQSADLFVGAAGTSVYEAAACQVPALTFSLSDNQTTQLTELEPLGHYFHLNDFSISDSGALAQLILTTINHYSRIKNLRDYGWAKVDGRGVERVTEVIENFLSKRRVTGKKTVPTRDMENAEIDDPDLPFSVRACDDRDINRYLDARNLDANRGNMTSAKPIRRIDHYNWWFSTQRHSYRVAQYGKPALYIWHELKKRLEKDVLVGGWFVTSDKTDIACVMSALSWQLERCDDKFPSVPWVAVIKKSNRFVFRMNVRAGFVEASSDSDYCQIIQDCFPDADPADFYYLYREPAESLLRYG